MAMRFVIDGEKYEFEFDSLMRSEVNLVKKVLGIDGLAKWIELLKAEDDDARDAMVWIAVKRKHPEMKFSELDFNILEFAESLEADEEPDAEPDPTVIPVESD
jgi:hypothetical protein